MTTIVNLGRTLERFNDNNSQFHVIMLGENKIGYIRIRYGNKIISIRQIAIIDEYQGNGYAQEAIATLENMFPQVECCELETIMQEEKLCHLYEKLGYTLTGKSVLINDSMTIVYYAKLRKTK